MTEVTDADYHLSFGLHSGIPLCCAIEFTDGGKVGPCTPCKEKGVTAKKMFSDLHQCYENNPSCVPYLQIIERRARQWFHKHRDRRPINLVKGEVDDFTWGTNLYMPMGGEFRDDLREAGYRLVHLCWPTPTIYWYIFQQQGGKKGKCGICNTKFSLDFPTPGKQV